MTLLLPRFRRLRLGVAAWLVAMGIAAAATPTTAPEVVGISHWINTPPLTMQGLRGKVVLIDFWAYSCINCLRAIPNVEQWYRKYHKAGLVVVGVHSPEFDFEHDAANVRAAVTRLGITYPVAQDDQMATWQAWDNHYWPAEYLVGRDGKVITHHYGEGHYAAMEQAIRTALGMAAPMQDAPRDKDFSGIGSPEMYFGLARVRNLADIEVPPQLSHGYTAPTTVALNQFALDGRWRLTDEYALLTGDTGLIRLRFKAGQLNMVAASDTPTTLEVSVDGGPARSVTVRESRLYTLFDSHDAREHVAVIRIRGRGLRAYTFTFG